MEDKVSTPNRISLKKLTLSILGNLQDSLDKNTFPMNVVILTAAGTFKGKLVEFNLEQEEESFVKEAGTSPEGKVFRIDQTIVFQQRKKIVDKYAEENGEPDIIDNGSVIRLIDAELLPLVNPNTHVNFPELILFVDQIIGFSLVSQ